MTVWKISVGALGLGTALAVALFGVQGDRLMSIAQSVPGSNTTANPIPVKPDVPYVPTPEAAVTAMLQLAGVNRNDVVYDLGSGDGRLVIAAVKDYDARRGVGVEINPGLVRLSNENAQKAGVSDRTQFLAQDLFRTDFSAASVVTLYLLPEVNLKLRPKLMSELKPGTRIVSNSFAMGDWKPDKSVTVPGTTPPRTLYYWVVPAKIAGDWQGQLELVPGRSQPYTLRFTQQFQQVKGDVLADGKKFAISNIALTGDRLTFSRTETVQGQQGVVQFNGRIEGDTLKGTAGVQWGVLARSFPIVAKRSSTIQGRALP